MKVADMLVDGLALWLRVVGTVCMAYVELDRRASRFARGPTRTGAEAWLWDEDRDGQLKLTAADYTRRVLREEKRQLALAMKYHCADLEGLALAKLRAKYEYPDNGGCLRSMSAERLNTRTMRDWDDYVKLMREEQEKLELETHGKDD
jgi:hypothetical protein